MGRTIYKLNSKIVEAQKETSKRDTYWIDINKPEPADLTFLQDQTGFPKQTIRRIIDEDEKPFVESRKSWTIVCFRAPWFESDHDVSAGTICLALSTKKIITVRSHDLKSIDRILKLGELSSHEKTPVKKLALDVLTEITKTYTQVLDTVEEKIDHLEDSIHSLDAELLEKSFLIKKTLMYFARSIKANRDVLHILTANKSKQLPDNDHFLYLLQDYAQLLDGVETLREVLHNLAELHQSFVSNNLNDSMKKMTVYGSLVLIPTLIASIYGMNFRFMPELAWKYGYPLSFGLMIVSVVAAYIIFKSKKWI